MPTPSSTRPGRWSTFLVSETRRTLLALLATSVVYVIPASLWLRGRGDPDRDMVTLLVGAQLAYFTLYLAITWLTFGRLARSGLLLAVRRATSRRARHWERLMGATPASWASAAVMYSLMVVVVTLTDPELRSDPLMILATIGTVVLGWLVLFTAATLTLVRLDAKERTLRFPDPGPHSLTDYAYAGVQVMTTFGTADVAILTTAGRRSVAWLSVAATLFNTVIVAILVSGMLSLVL